MTLVTFALIALICMKLLALSLCKQHAERVPEYSTTIDNSKGGSE